MRAGKALLEAMKQEGVEVVFGYPGGSVIPLFDDLYDSSLLQILPRHEQGGAHAADGYARASGKVGVVIVTSGPGATNVVTGIANAYLDSVPLIVIAGQVKTHLIGTDAFQEADITGITLPIVKHSYLVTDAEELPRIVHEAFYLAGTGRPGPVLIDLPVDVSLAEIEYDPKAAQKIDLPGYKPTLKGHPKQIKAAARIIAEAERPIVYAGGGIISANAAEELRELAVYGHIPVTTTLTGETAYSGERCGHGNVTVYGKFSQLLRRIRGDDSSTGVDNGPFRFSDDPCGSFDLLGMALESGLVTRQINLLGRLRVIFYLCQAHVYRKVNQHWSRTPCTCQIESLVHNARQFFRVGDQVAVFDYWKGDAGDVRLLEGLRTDERRLHLTGDDNQRDTVQIRVGYPGHNIGRSRTRSDDHYPHFTRGPCVTVRRVCPTLLMSRQYLQ